MKIRPFPSALAIVASICLACSKPAPPPPEAALAVKPAALPASDAAEIQKDYDALTGRWQLVKSVVDGKPVPEEELRKTVLVTDHDIFRFPAHTGVGTAPQGRFTIDPTKQPKQVDSTALAGPDKDKVSLGIYEILDADNKRACWAKPGAARPTGFTSAPGSGWTVQDWRLISKSVGD